MDIICPSCSTKLMISDEKVPKDAVFKVTCPKCQTKVTASTKSETGAPPPSLEEVPEDLIPSPTTEDDFVEDQRLAIICFEQPKFQVAVRAALEGLGYTVHVPAKADDVVQRLRQNHYDVLLLHEDYGGSPENNLVLLTIQPMMMAHRRHMCVGLVGKEFRTFDHMLAFTKSVKFVVAERELNKIKAITHQAVAENDQFYRVFREALRDAGKS